MNTAEGFTRNILITGDCWIWSAGHSSDGYGKVRWQNRVMRAHRAAWEIFRGAVPDGLFVLHRCDNPPCVNPNHLFLGTQEDNVRDCLRKGRFRRGIRPPESQRGEKNNYSKLTVVKVKEIRTLYRQGGCTLRGLGEAYGVSYGTIDNAIRKKTWAFVD